MRKKNRLTGIRYGRLTVLCESEERTKNRDVKWLCICDCGNQSLVTGCNLKNGTTKSCGCYHKEVTKIGGNFKHGMHGNPLYNKWAMMKKRCRDENQENYYNYGGRGITVCDEWNSFEPFRDWSLANGYVEGLQIDRVDNNLGYSPENCRYVTRMENANNRRNNRSLEINGIVKTASEWARESGISTAVIYQRLKRGKTGTEIIKPVKVK